MPALKTARRSRRLLWYLLLTALLLGGAALYGTWRVRWQPNVAVSPYGAAYHYIRTGTGYAAVLDTLRRQELLRDSRTFGWLAARRG
ncbi:MAG: hypothetical protein H7Z21_14355, partial [Hymenobacter sp.]|nr:hypothetical protein [Hymenobacter sp.]